MARGRFITKDICLDKTVNDINDAWSMLAFTWLITHADCDGRGTAELFLKEVNKWRE